MKKAYLSLSIGAVLLALLLIGFGIMIGRNEDLLTAFFSTPTTNNTITPTPTATKTPMPTSTPTPTLAPGEFQYSASEISMNFLLDLGLHCTEPTESKLGGYFWYCIGTDGTNFLRANFFGLDKEKINYIYAYALNTYSPSAFQASVMFRSLTRNVFPPSDSHAIDTKVFMFLQSLSGSGNQIIQDTVNGYPILVTGPGICRVLTIGNPPAQQIDRDIVPILSELEYMCTYFEEEVP
ncbi:MAG: hypothetical protein U1B80_09955 [Anaerolineaceae bacterium]|nr:hypothetical protein [Anaerolineaceae bacterium]